MEPASILRQCGLFDALDATALAELAALGTVLPIAGGARLFAAGSPPDRLYIVATGRLRALRDDGSVAGDIGRLEPIGEISVLTGEPRSSEVYALRDSLLIAIERNTLLTFVAAHPSALIAITRVLIRRLRQNQRPAALAGARHGQALAVLPASRSVDLESFLESFGRALGRIDGDLETIRASNVDEALGCGAARTPLAHDAANHRLLDFLAAHEASGRRLLYVANGAFAAPSTGSGRAPIDGGSGDEHRIDAWTERCLRQADRVLIVASHASRATDSAVPALLRRLRLRAPVELVFIDSPSIPSAAVRDWRAQCDLAAHHHLRAGHAGDLMRLARTMSGQALGLVLGGGGARGFAHIGLLRALEESGRSVDLVGGTSMGALFAALIACGADARELRRVAGETFVQNNYLNDYVLPRVSLIRGRRFAQRLQAIFGDRMIEETALPYFCVSTNLTRGTAMVHDEGPLAIWVGTSMAVPGVAPPIVFNGDLLADGAIVNGLPTDVMKSYGRGPIIASDVSTEGGLAMPGIVGPDPEALLRRSRTGTGMNLADILFRSATLVSDSGMQARAASADLYLRMPVAGVGLFDWKRIDEVIERGYRHAVRELEGMKLPDQRRS